MSTLISPNIFQHSDYKSFLKAFWDENKDLPFFSSRYLALKLGWSSSYFHDVLGERKKLTVSKAIEIADYIKLDTKGTEYLVWLVLVDTDHLQTSSFSNKMILSFL